MGWWSKVKNFVKGVARTIVKVVVEVVHWVINALGSIFLFWMTKKLRIHVCILHEPGGKELVSIAEAEASVARATAIIKSRFDVKVVKYGNPFVQVIKEDPPPSALGTQCNASGYGSEYREAGAFFAKHTAGWNAIPITVVHPLTVFVVKEIHDGSDPKRGCSFGMLTDYLVVKPNGVNDDTTLSHEIAHSCNLFHRDDSNNLMFKEFTRGTSITGWQKWWFRSSRRVNFW